MKLRWIVLQCLATLPALAVIVRAQQAEPQQVPTFKSGTQVVEVDVRVFDKEGHFVTNLDPADFEIKEDGVVQPIASATLIGEPGTPNQNQNQNPKPPNPTPEPLNPRTSEPGAGARAPATWIFDARGVIQIHAGALADAIESFQRATKLASKDPVGFFNLASAHHAAALRLRQLSRSGLPSAGAIGEDHKLASRSGGFGLMEKARWQRTAAIDAYHRVIALKGQYVEEAKRGLAALQAK